MKLAVPIKFLKLHDDAVIPKYMTSGAACVDLVATEIEHLDENKVTVRFGFATEFMDGYKVILKPRSGFNHKGWVMQNSPGTIDSDYRGEWMAKFEAIPVGVNTKMSGATLLYMDFPYKVGERVLQAEIEANIHMAFREEKALTTSERGAGGFGHTGQ